MANNAYHPMLAQPADKPITTYSDGWVFEPKYDGIRCIWVNNTLYSRSGRDITDQFPELTGNVQLAHRVLDGEIVMLDEDGHVSFNHVARRTPKNAHSQPPATFMCFDVLEAGLGAQAAISRATPFWERRAYLESTESTLPEHCLLVPQMDDGSAMWSASIALGHEGVIAKRLTSTYRAGRSPNWLKFKKERTLSAVVVGAEPGTGHRAATFGALELALSDGTGVVQIGSVGSGFTKADEHAIHERLVKNQKLLEEGKQPDLFVVEVKYMELTKNQDAKERKAFPFGKLRFPVFLGVREDISPVECLTTQLEA